MGFNPVIPHIDAGCRTDPPVSEPSAKRAIPDATETAPPPLLPPGTRSESHGFSVLPDDEPYVDEPIANSSMLGVPIIIASSCSNFSTVVALYGE